MSIKIGIIGAGGMIDFHAPGFLEAHAEITALVDPNRAAADQVATRYGIPAVYSNLEEMLIGSPEIEAVSIITPNKFHSPWPFSPRKPINTFFAKNRPRSMRQRFKK
jgi:predicted dehydrogenase